MTLAHAVLSQPELKAFLGVALSSHCNLHLLSFTQLSSGTISLLNFGVSHAAVSIRHNFIRKLTFLEQGRKCVLRSEYTYFPNVFHATVRIALALVTRALQTDTYIVAKQITLYITLQFFVVII
jgi:hypothetical protein